MDEEDAIEAEREVGSGEKREFNDKVEERAAARWDRHIREFHKFDLDAKVEMWEGLVKKGHPLPNILRELAQAEIDLHKEQKVSESHHTIIKAQSKVITDQDKQIHDLKKANQDLNRIVDSLRLSGEKQGEVIKELIKRDLAKPDLAQVARECRQYEAEEKETEEKEGGDQKLEFSKEEYGFLMTALLTRMEVLSEKAIPADKNTSGHTAHLTSLIRRNLDLYEKIQGMCPNRSIAAVVESFPKIRPFLEKRRTEKLQAFKKGWFKCIADLLYKIQGTRGLSGSSDSCNKTFNDRWENSAENAPLHSLEQWRESGWRAAKAYAMKVQHSRFQDFREKMSEMEFKG